MEYKRVKKQFYLKHKTYEWLEAIANQSGYSASVVIDKLIMKCVKDAQVTKEMVEIDYHSQKVGHIEV